MNALTERFPTRAKIDGQYYELNTDFRIGIKIMLAFEDAELSVFEKQLIMLRLLYKEIPPDTQKACELAVKFLDCGESGGTAGSGGDGTRYYSFAKDAKYIYSAIRKSHGIDLDATPYLHWWKFCYMFMDLREDCMFSRILYYRQQRRRGKLTAEERAYCAQIADILDLPGDWSPEEQDAADEFMRLLRGEVKVSTDDRS